MSRQCGHGRGSRGDELLEPTARERAIVPGKLLDIEERVEALVSTERRSRGIALLGQVGVGIAPSGARGVGQWSVPSRLRETPVGNRPGLGRTGSDAATRGQSIAWHVRVAVVTTR
jgi:hypothetical protein